MAGLIDIATACSNLGVASVIGVAVDVMGILQTKGSSSCITFEIKDEDLDGYAWKQSLKVKYFNDNESNLPHVMLNDVVLLRSIQVKEFNRRATGVASQGQRVAWAIFRADEDPSKSPSITTGPFNFIPTPGEKAKASALLEQVQHKLQPQTPQRTRRGTIPQQSTTVVEASLATPTPWKGKMPVSQIKDAVPNNLCQIVAQVVQDHHYDSDKSTIWVTDYTSNEGLPDHEKDDSMTGTDGDPYGHLSSKDKDWPGPWGKLTMQVTLWNPHATFARSKIRVGDIVFLSYVRPKISKNGNLEAAISEDKMFPHKVHLRVVSTDYDVHAKELMKRRKEYWKIHGDSKDDRKDDSRPAKKQKVEEPKKTPQKEGNRTSLPVAALTTSSRVKPNPQVKPLAVGIPTSSINSILAAETHVIRLPGDLDYKVPFQNVGYTLLARVVDFFPPKLEDFAVQVSSKSIIDDDTESVTWEWRFCLLVEGTERLTSKNQQRQQLKIFVAGAEAEHLLCLDATNLRRNEQRLNELREKLFILWGNLEEQKQEAAGNPIDDEDWKPVKSSSLPFTCCIKEYGVPCRDARGSDAMAIDGQLCVKEECFGWERRFALYVESMDVPNPGGSIHMPVDKIHDDIILIRNGKKPIGGQARNCNNTSPRSTQTQHWKSDPGFTALIRRYANTTGCMMSKSNRGDSSGIASSQHISGILPRCRTCRNCRQKKVKCDGRYPQCSACNLRGVECMYPRDARRSAVRTKRVDIKDLERQIEELKKQIQETPNRSQAVADVTLGEDTPNVQYAPDLRHRNLLSPQDDQSPSPAQPQFESTPRVSGGHRRIGGSARTTASDSRIDTHVAAGGSELPEQAEHEHEQSPDPITADGNIQVYGATSLLHDQSSRTPLANQLAQSGGQHEVATEIIKARLISNAALRRQEELKLLYTPSIGTSMDFDGVPMDLALHLLNLHWNRSHLSYLISYRPAVMDSLFNNGPYINKLLLNAIYLQSSLYNDRSLPPGLQHPKNNGLVFYERFKLLLPQYLDAPVLPTVVALLTCGACLVPYGKQSAGWALCGMAYQMIIDLGCHLELSSYEGERTGTSTMLEQEMKKRIYWGAFVSDKFQSLFLGRPPMMHEDIGNISCNYLDSFEEMEEWRPYYDPISQPIEESVPAYFRGTPSYAVSTFQSLLRLCKIATEIINAFYATNSAKSSESTLLQTRDSVLEQIGQWHQTLSPWLRFDPTMGTILAPHQITPHALHWTLIILTEQAFLNRGHFGFTLEPQMEEIARQRCIQAALNIWKLVDVYRKTFTLRRAQYGISYATYCAVLVLLQHTRHDNQEYNECIRFFWSALWEYQKGCNQGLIRPLHLLRSLMRRLKRTMEDLDAEEGNVAAQSLVTTGEPTTNIPFIDSHSDLDLNNWDCSWLNSLTDDGLMSGDLVFGFFA